MEETEASFNDPIFYITFVFCAICKTRSAVAAVPPSATFFGQLMVSGSDPDLYQAFSGP